MTTTQINPFTGHSARLTLRNAAHYIAAYYGATMAHMLIMQAIERVISSELKSNKQQGNSYCLACGVHLAYCGNPFSAELICYKCGAINVYEESQFQPIVLKRIQGKRDEMYNLR